MAKKKEIEETNDEFNGLWVLMLLSLLFIPPKEPKVINIYMGDE